MKGYSVKEIVGGVSIEWIWDVDSDDITVIKSVDFDSQSTVIDITEVPANIYNAFTAMTEGL